MTAPGSGPHGERETEHDFARRLAHRVLDRINADPDDDLAVLARQLLRADEHISALGLDGTRKIVPVEPTEAMVIRGHAAGVREKGLWALFTGDSPIPLRLVLDYLPAAYRAMLAAAPPSAQEAGDND